jgi:hypothetical protein
MKFSKEKFFSSNIFARTNRNTGLTIAIKLCGNHIKVATALAGTGEKFKHKQGMDLAVLNVQNHNRVIVLPIDHKGLGLSKQQRLIALMNNFDSYFTDVFYN